MLKVMRRHAASRTDANWT